MRERTIGRMLKKLGLRSKIARKYKHTTDSNHRLLTAPNFLDRQFTVTQPNNVWTTDITYIRTKQGWLYLCVMRLIMEWLVRIIQQVSWCIPLRNSVSQAHNTVVVILGRYY